MSQGPYQYIYDFNPFHPGEDLEDYQMNALCPVDIGSIFTGFRGHYQVINKLGSGATSTVWIAHDMRNRELVALKVLMASVSTTSSEDQRILALREFASLQSCTVQFKESFSVKSPNCGPDEHHTILVLELLGPPLARFCRGRTLLQSSVARQVLHRIAESVAELHRAGVVHRDLTADNVVLRLDHRVDKLSPGLFTQWFGEPNKMQISRVDGHSAQPMAPSHVVDTLDFLSKVEYITTHPVLIDFEESRPVGEKPTDQLMTSAPWAAPEVIIDNSFSTAADIWSLGCLIYQARAGQEIFGLEPRSEVFFEMLYALGLPPFPRWHHVEFDEFGHTVASGKESDCLPPLIDPLLAQDYPPLKDRIFNIRNRPAGIQSNGLYWGTGEWCVAEDRHTYPKIPLQEANLLYDLLSKIFQWDPEKRMTAAEVVRHPWFTYRDEYACKL